MKYAFWTSLGLLSIMLVAFVAMKFKPHNSFVIETSDAAECYVGKVKLKSGMSVRLLVLKHCPDSIANTDSNQAIQAANLAATKGLTIRDIGNHHINKDGPVDRGLVWGKKTSLVNLQEFISQQMKIDAESGDTLIVYTIGHGSGGGTLMWIGQREILMTAIANAAEENGQETLWWQLSCHAAAGLPEISSLNEKQQELFAMVASSPANRVSYFLTQGEQLEKLFAAMADGSPTIDPDQDQIITAQELKDFLNNEIEQGRGDLVYARSPDEPIFGWWDFANMLPIVDQDGRPQNLPEEYVPRPR
jgi:hypothetical protein